MDRTLNGAWHLVSTLLKNVCSILDSLTTKHTVMEEKWNYQGETDGESDPRSAKQHAWLCRGMKIAWCPALALVLSWHDWLTITQRHLQPAGWGQGAEARKGKEPSLGLFWGQCPGEEHAFHSKQLKRRPVHICSWFKQHHHHHHYCYYYFASAISLEVILK